MYTEIHSGQDLGLESEEDGNLAISNELEPYDQGLLALENGNYSRAYKLWLSLAQDGHINSQYMLGRLFENGQGRDIDLEGAISWYERAAKAGQAEAQYRLGLYYINEAEDINKTLGLYWIQSAADNNNAQAIEYMANDG